MNGGSLILLGVLVVMVPAVAWALLTMRGSGIRKHPTIQDSDAPLAEQESEEASVDQHEVSPTNNSHGMR